MDDRTGCSQRRGKSGSEVHGLEDIVTQMFAEDGPAVVIGPAQRVAKIDPALFVQPDHFVAPQAGDKATEQTAIEKLRRVELIKEGDALGHELTQIFQLAHTQHTGTMFEQQRHGDVVPLQGLQHVARQN